jgi:hypothetical protein
MTVFINGHRIQIFHGARVGDAVLAYSAVSLNKVKSGKFIVVDRFGYQTALDGPLKDHQKIFIKQNINESTY